MPSFLHTNLLTLKFWSLLYGTFGSSAAFLNWRLGLLNLPLLPRSMSPFRLLFSMKVSALSPCVLPIPRILGVVFCWLSPLSDCWVVHGPTCSFQPKAMPASFSNVIWMERYKYKCNQRRTSESFLCACQIKWSCICLWRADLTLGKNHCPNYFQEQKQLNLHTHTHAHTHNPRGTGRVKFFRLSFGQAVPRFLAHQVPVSWKTIFSMDCRHRKHDLGMIKVHSTYCGLFFY